MRLFHKLLIWICIYIGMIILTTVVFLPMINAKDTLTNVVGIITGIISWAYFLERAEYFLLRKK